MVYQARRPNPVFSDDYQVLRSVLVGARRRAGLTQRALARRLGKTASHISKLETGQRRLDVLEAYLLSQCFGLQPADLFAEMSEKLDAARKSSAAQEAMS